MLIQWKPEKSVKNTWTGFFVGIVAFKVNHHHIDKEIFSDIKYSNAIHFTKKNIALNSYGNSTYLYFWVIQTFYVFFFQEEIGEKIVKTLVHVKMEVVVNLTPVNAFVLQDGMAYIVKIHAIKTIMELIGKYYYLFSTKVVLL